MTRKEAFEKIKNLLFTEEKTFGEAKLADGTIIQWEGEIAEGTAINVVSEDGNITPAPDGTHQLEDGTMVTTVGGLVTDIESKEEEEVEVETKEQMASDFEKTFAEEFGKMKDKIAALEAEMADCKEKMSAYGEKFEAIGSEVKDAEKSIADKFSAIESLVLSVAEAPVEPSKNNQPKNSTFKKNTGNALADYINWKNQRTN
jgi:septal ring factor EnvC (AmiA/AmiB activator)